MSPIGFRGRRLAALLAVPLLGCDQPPAKEIAAAETALAQAREAGADRYAADRYREAESALRDAQRKVQERDFRGALSSANEAGERARSALPAAAAARTVAKSATEVALAELQAGLDEVAAIQQDAKDERAPDQLLAELAPRLAEADAQVTTIRGQLEAGQILEAQKAATALKAQMADLPARAREALTAWEAKHPRHPKPRRAKPS